MLKIKKLITTASISILLMSAANFAFALEIGYPDIPLAPHIEQGSTASQYIQYYFILIVVGAGIIGVLSIVFAGLRILLAFGSPTAIGEARERIFNSILGIILLMISVILLKTINPDLVTPRDSYLNLQQGVYLRGEDPTAPDGYVYKPAPDTELDTSYIPSPYNEIVYKCSPPGKALRIWTYGDTDFRRSDGGDGDTTVIECGEDKAVNIRNKVSSFIQEPEDTGVYYYLEKDCGGLATCDFFGGSCAQKSSGDIPLFDLRNDNDLDQEVKSLMIVNGKESLEKYGTVLTKNYSLAGECSPVYIDKEAVPGEHCKNVENDSYGDSFNPYSAHIINQASFYSGTNSVNISSNNLELKLGKSDIQSWYFVDNPDDLLKKQGSAKVGKGAPKEECTEDDVDSSGNRIVCINKIKNTGNFNEILYSQSQFLIRDPSGKYTYTRSCEIFNNGIDDTDPSNPDLDFQDLIDYNVDEDTYGNSLYRMDIVPYPQ